MAGKKGTTMLIASGAIFVVFVANIVLGASGAGVFLSDVGEMLTLFAACICFVVAFLQRELAAKSSNQTIGIDTDEGGKTT